MSRASMLPYEGHGLQSDGAGSYRDNNQPMSAALLQAAAQASAQESSESPPDDHEVNEEQEAPAKRTKRSRACQACRGMKIRCLPVEGQEACRACSKVNRTCVMPGPARKRQKTVHKVAELEEKINALTASLAAKGHVDKEPMSPTESPRTTSTPSVHTLPSSLSGRKERSAYYYDMQTSSKPLEESHDTRFWENADARMIGKTPPVIDDYIDVITRGNINQDEATKIFNRWKKEMCPYCPFIAFPPTTTLDWLRWNRPITLLAILGAACGTIRPDLQSDLMVELARQVAERVTFLHEKSLDLIQAMLITPIWFGKHRYAKDLNFNHSIHSAVAMCLDLGLGKRSRKRPDRSDMEDLERRRTWMGCYYLAGSCATALRLPQLVHFSPYLGECLDVMSKSPSALPTDNFVCSLVRLMHMYEDVGILFQMDDPGSTIQLDDSRTQYNLKMFERQLEDWKKSTQELIPKTILDQYVAVTNLYVHEITLHTEHNVDDFRPIAHEHMYNSQVTTSLDSLNNTHLDALAICVDSMEKAMTAFGEIDLDVLRALPCLHMVWIAYVAVAMIRLDGLLRAPNSKYGSIFLPKMNVGQHLDNIIQRLTVITADSSHSAAEGFLQAFRKLKAWSVIRIGGEVTQNGPPVNSDGDATRDTRYERRDTAGTIDSTTTTGTVRHHPLPAPQSSMPTTMPSPSQVNNTSQAHRGSYSYNNNKPQNSSSNIDLYPSSSSTTTQRHSFHPQNQYQNNTTITNSNTNTNTTTATASGSSLLDSNTAIDPSAFDIDNWSLNMNELNNFDTYMNDVGWMGYLI